MEIEEIEMENWKQNKKLNTMISGVWKMEEEIKERKFMVMDETEHDTWCVDSPR